MVANQVYALGVLALVMVGVAVVIDLPVLAIAALVVITVAFGVALIHG